MAHDRMHAIFMSQTILYIVNRIEIAEYCQNSTFDDDSRAY